MILAIDAGNTRLKWGWHDGARWTSLESLEIAQLEALSANPLNDAQEAPTRIVIANVAGAKIAARLSAWTAGFRVPPHWLRAERTRCGVTNLYDAPEQLGADRWAALIAARKLQAVQPGECLVVCAGTATTADMLNAHGEFVGGVILPGRELMKAALHRNTGGLPLGTGSVRPAPRNTLDAIESGCMYAQAGAIERMRRELAPHANCLISGGAGRQLLECLPFPAGYVENLVLEGLALVAAGT